MKYFIAIIKPFKLDDVRKALTQIGVEGLTASEVRGFGRQRGQTEIYRGTEYSVSFVPKLKIELAVPDELEEKVLETLNKSANTGQIGDGKIFVFDIKSATRIRTGETGNDALSNLEFAIEQAMMQSDENTVLDFLRAFCDSY